MAHTGHPWYRHWSMVPTVWHIHAKTWTVKTEPKPDSTQTWLFMWWRLWYATKRMLAKQQIIFSKYFHRTAALGANYTKVVAKNTHLPRPIYSIWRVAAFCVFRWNDPMALFSLPTELESIYNCHVGRPRLEKQAAPIKYVCSVALTTTTKQTKLLLKSFHVISSVINSWCVRIWPQHRWQWKG